MATPYSDVPSAVAVLVATRRVAEAVELARSTLAGPGVPGEVAGSLLLTLSSIDLLDDQAQSSLAEASAVMALRGLPEDLYDAAGLARLLAALARGDFALGRNLAYGILAGDEDARGSRALIGALTALSFAAWSEGRVGVAVNFLRIAVRRAEQGPWGPHRIHPQVSLATMLATVGDFDEAGAVMDAAEAEDGLVGESVWSAALPLARARLDLAMGRLGAAAEGAERSLVVASEMRTRSFVPPGEWILACVALCHGDLDDAQRRVLKYREALVNSESVGSSSYALTAVVVAMALGDHASARTQLAPLDEPMTLRHLLTVDGTAAACLVRHVLALGDPTRAEMIVVEADRISEVNAGFPYLEAAAAHARGLLSDNRAALETAVEKHRHPWARASALEDLGALPGRADRAVSRADTETAMRSYEEVSARRDALRCRRRLRSRARARGDRPSSGWSSLSKAELRVLLVVAAGRTNVETAQQLSISPHTVDFHLRSIFRKLGVGTRTELVRIVLEHDRPRSRRAD
jgi:DNA-binding CsgD family transcriptional regulator